MKQQNNHDHELLTAMGLRPVINAAGHPSRLGGTHLAPSVIAAMAAAARTFVPIAEMQARASEMIASLTGAEAGCVATGADACLTLAAAACMTGDDFAAMDRLPDTTGLRNEIGVCVTITVIAALASFDVVFMSTQGGPGRATMVPGVEVYQLGFTESRIGTASALAIVLALLILVVVIPLQRLFREK